MLAFRSPIRRDVTLRPIMTTKAQENALYSIYYDSIRIWSALASQVAAQWLVPTITVDADGQQIQWLIDNAQSQADNTLVYQTEKLGRWVTRMGAWHGDKTIAGVKSATGVDIEPFMRLSDIQPELRMSISRNVSLISNVNADTKNRIEQVIYNGFAQRWNKKKLTDELAKAMGVTKRRARLIAGDQTKKLGIGLTKRRNLQLGITKYKWVRTISKHERPHHLARVGKIFEWEKPPFDGPPGYAIGCKCSAQGYIEYGDE